MSLGSAADVDRAVTAAKAAFRSYSQTSKAERVALLGAVAALLSQARSTSSPRPSRWRWALRYRSATAAQAPMGLAQLNAALGSLA